jgi:PAS domain S-box-containing protein
MRPYLRSTMKPVEPRQSESARILAVGEGGTGLRSLRRRGGARPADNDQLALELEEEAARPGDTASSEWKNQRDRFFRLSVELLALVNHDGVITHANPTWHKALGYHESDMLGCRLLDFIHPDDIDATRATMVNILQADTSLYFESRFRAADGGYRWLAWTIAQYAAEGLLYVFARDISNRRERENEIHRLNVELEQRTRSLQTLNTELESFSCSLAHDLKTPLRSILAFSEMLAGGEGGELAPEALRMVRSIHRNSDRMAQLMDDFLAFFRVARNDVKQESISMDAIVREAMALVAHDERRVIDFKVGELPSASGDAGMVLQVFVNLLSNAVKFTGGRERAVIEVGCVPGSAPHVYFVKDNGVGFDMKYYGRLFGMFERLHRREDFEGTGVGLAIVQKVVQRHGGRAWAEAVVDQGATFYFTLEPAPEPARRPAA